MDTPFAITLDVGSSLANRTGSWRWQAIASVAARPVSQIKPNQNRPPLSRCWSSSSAGVDQ